MTPDNWIESYCERNDLAESFKHSAITAFADLGEYLAKTIASNGFCVFGLNGAQGTGKSTLAKFLVAYLKAFYDLKGCALSLDDFYLTKTEREVLSIQNHPLLKTRGVPGTHDVQLAISTLNALKHLIEGQTYRIPKFDKIRDDRSDFTQWSWAQGKQDFIIFEGWCVGSPPANVNTLREPINALERDQDPDSIWRVFVNTQLREKYAALWALMDKLIVLQAPSFEASQEWRIKQEARLSHESIAHSYNPPKTMSDAEIIEFMDHYERISRRNISDLPKIADLLIKLDTNHNVYETHYKSA